MQQVECLMEERQEFGGELECVEGEIELAVSGGVFEFGRGLEFEGELEYVEDEIKFAVSGGDLEFGRGLESGGELECVLMRLNLLFQEEILSFEEDLMFLKEILNEENPLRHR